MKRSQKHDTEQGRSESSVLPSTSSAHTLLGLSTALPATAVGLAVIWRGRRVAIDHPAVGALG